MLRPHSHQITSLQIALDVAFSGLVLILMLSVPEATGVKAGEAWRLDGPLLAVVIAACMSWPLVLDLMGLYGSHRREPLEQIVGRIAVAALVATLVLMATASISGSPVKPHFAILFGAAQFSILAMERVAIHGALRLARRFDKNVRFALIVGSGPRAAAVKRRIDENPHWGIRIIGFLDDGDAPHSPEIDPAAMRKLIDIREILRNQVVDEVLIAVPRSMLSVIGPVVTATGEAGVPFTLLSDLFGDFLPLPQVTRLGSLGALRFAAVDHSPTLLFAKRALDVLGATVGLVLAAPVIGAAAIAIAVTSPGPIFFRQMRCGLHGRRFSMTKLRTMTADAEQRLAELVHLNEMSGPVFKIRKDPRITSVGRWLRRFSIDELPQLWNVLRGDMSLVGPRPPIPHEVVQYETFEKRRLSMRPGLTGAWQVSGRNRVSDFSDWVRLDLDYIDAWSIGRDLRILLMTLPAVFRATGE